jgi:disulfide bond formation protein DsbB
MWGAGAGRFNAAAVSGVLTGCLAWRVGDVRSVRYLLRMIPSIQTFAGFVLVMSAIVLGAALFSQYWGGLAPCELCILQRWPWAVAITISIVALFVGHRRSLPWVALVLGLVFLVSAGFAFYHLGVEQHWFAGPSACTPSSAAPTTLEEMRQRILSAQVVRCDEPQWSLFGVSLAGLNLLASIVMAAICAGAFWFARPVRRIESARRAIG